MSLCFADLVLGNHASRSKDDAGLKRRELRERVCSHQPFSGCSEDFKTYVLLLKCGFGGTCFAHLGHQNARVGTLALGPLGCAKYGLFDAGFALCQKQWL